jgi:hypothetical protein
VLDYMGEHKLNGLVLWGFLRDNHGGAEDARALTDYANTRGVRVLPGIGTSFYGGFYYYGAHPFHMDTWLADNPDAYFLLRNNHRLVEGDTGLTRFRNALCPSQPENRDWLRRGAEWMFTEFPKLDGANLENGDFFTCQCQRCTELRAKPTADPNFYYDMAVTQMPVIEAARKLRADPWMTYATYTGFNPEEMWKHTDPSLIRSKIPRFVAQYPETAICQWTFTSMVKGWGEEPENEVRQRWPRGLRPPTKHSIGLLHQGSQWYRQTKEWWTRSPRGNNTGQRYVDISELIRYTCERCAQEGLEGLEILGEVSDASPANEVNYLAFEEFTWHPRTSMEEFVRGRLAPVYGGEKEARRFLELVRSNDQSAANLVRDMQFAAEMAQSRQMNARQRRRWANLRAELARRISLAP